MKRFKHSLSHYKLATAKMGRLVPVGLVEALPGDTFQHSTSALLRLSPLVAPVMHPVSVRIHHWFVPHRLTMPDWEDFITGGQDGASTAEIPTAGAFTPQQYSLYDYFGVRPGIAYPAGTLSLLPLRAYNMIYNNFYRDQDLVTEVNEDTNTVQNIAWEKDYFTTARPWAQRGAAVTLPLGTSAPITGAGINIQSTPTFTNADGTSPLDVNTSGSGAVEFAASQIGGPLGGNLAWGSHGLGLDPMLADLTSATAVEVNEVRRAFALQRYQEARAQYGARYTEYLRYLGIKSSDARLQLPEYLGGGKQTIAFSEVLRTGNDQGSTDPIGEMKGHGISALRSNKYRYFCEEHGYILTLLSVRPRSMYVDGLPRTLSKRSKEDFYQKELELIGQQEVYNRELFNDGTAADNAVFGYQDRYSEYRHQPSSVAAEFRDTLDYWHLGRKFLTHPTLNATFVNCEPSARIFAEQTMDHLWMMISHSIQARRMVGHHTTGRII